MDRQFIRILQPADPWFADAPDSTELSGEFRGAYPGISVCDTTACTRELALAAFYGNTTRPTPIRPSVLHFTDREVVAAGGHLSKTRAEPPWPPEYDAAHHDIDRGQDRVAAAMVAISIDDPARRHVADRLEFVRKIVELALRPDAGDFRKKTRKRLKRLLSEEPTFYEALLKLEPRANEVLQS